MHCTNCGIQARPGDFYCDWCGAQLKRREILTKEVDCSPYIHHKHLSGFIYRYHERLPYTDRKLLQEALTLVTNESRWVMENAQLTVYGTLAKVIFYSGDRTNKYVVHLTGQDRPAQVVEHRGWRLKLRDGFKTAWGWLKSAAGAVAGALAGGLGRLAVGWL